MAITLVIPIAWVHSIISELHRHPTRVAVGALGRNEYGETDIELLVRSWRVVHEREAHSRWKQGAPGYMLGFVPDTVNRPRAWESVAWAMRLDHDPPYRSTCTIQLGTGPDVGMFTGIYAEGQTIHPVEQLRLVGAGMPIFQAVDFLHAPTPVSPHDAERWSRVIGALGEASVWRRLASLQIAVIGSGRTGSVIAASLAKQGVKNLVLIDPDHLELSNLDAMDLVTEQDLGRPKAEAVAARLREAVSQAVVTPLVMSVLSHNSVRALKQVHVIICAVDDPLARLVSGVLATCYLKPWLDIGTGIFRGEVLAGERQPDRELRMGADIRLAVPGDGCVFCLGGVGDLSGVLQRWGQARTPRPWQEERAGSLRSLNLLAAGTALRWLEEMVGGRLSQSIWQRVEINTQGLADWRRFEPRRDAGCTLCTQLGRGDDVTTSPTEETIP